MDVTVRVPAIEKLLDITVSGVASIAGPALAPWRARREAEAKLITERADADARIIVAEGDAAVLSVIAEAYGHAEGLLQPGVTMDAELAIADKIEQRGRVLEARWSKNLGAIVGQAAAELKDGEVEDGEENDDWAAYFFEHARHVSSEEMQTLWARILAGEVERPGSTSLLTLGVLRELDKEVAASFQRLCSLAVSIAPDDKSILDTRVPSLGGNAGDNALRSYGLAFGTLNLLSEHGLIISDYNSWYDYRLAVGVASAASTLRIPFRFQNRSWVLEPSQVRAEDQELRIAGVALTRAGRELSRVVEIEAQNDYMVELTKFFDQHHLRMVESPSTEPHFRPS